MELRLLREGLSTSSRHEKNLQITRQFLEFDPFQRAQTIHFYLSNPVEVSTDALIQEAFRLKKRVAVPVMSPQGETFFFSELRDFDTSRLETGPFGIRQPHSSYQREISLQEIDLWVLPGMGFDRSGNRLGQGKGFYDRVLHQTKKPNLGLAYDFQILDRLPVESTDWPVDQIITETQIIPCKEIRDGRKNH